MKNLLMICLAIFGMAVVAGAADYAVKRVPLTMPGGATVVSLPLSAVQAQASGAELIEVDVGGGAVADTVTVARVTGDLKFTNTIVSVTTSTASNTLSSAYNTLANSSGSSDKLTLGTTGAGTPPVSLLFRTHQTGTP